MTRFTYKYLKPVALFLAIVFLFQCCKIYDKRPVTVEKAITVNHKKVKRIKIDMFDNKKLVLDSIYYKDNELFGFLTRKNIEVNINEDKIIQIRLYNSKKSKTGTVFLVFGSIVTGIIILVSVAIAIECNGKDCSGGLFSDGI